MFASKTLDISIAYVPTSLRAVAAVVTVMPARPICASVNVVSCSNLPFTLIIVSKATRFSPYFLVILTASTVTNALKKYLLLEKPPSVPLVPSCGGVYALISGLPRHEFIVTDTAPELIKVGIIMVESPGPLIT